MLGQDRCIPLLIVNSTNKLIKLYRHGLLARISPLQKVHLKNINSVLVNNKVEKSINISDLDVPDEHRAKIKRLVEDNNDICKQGLKARTY